MTIPLRTYLNIQAEMVRLKRRGMPENDPEMRMLRDQLGQAHRETVKDGIEGVIDQARDLMEEEWAHGREYEAHLEDLGRGY